MADILQSGAGGDGSTDLGRSLRVLRVRAGINQMALAERTGLSQSQISRAETDRRILSPEEVGRFADACEAAVGEREQLVELAERLARRHVDGRAILQRGAHHFQVRIRQYEEDSALIRSYGPGMVKGQLQTAAYVRAVFSARSDRAPEEVERLVAERLRRADLLHDPVRRSELIMTEGALTWCLGGPAVMAEQLEHIIAVAELPTVDLGIVPAYAPASFTAPHAFTLYDAAVVLVGTRSGSALMSDRDDIVSYAELFTDLSRIAVRGDAARAILIRIRDEYRSRM